ncbi:hypothetical protein EHQ81_18090 [Leptospira selangorensis]|uniref:Lipoprotein n=1 Tax=Leptospira selangorensis TaxID=2484982 RepID=A0A5F2C699_9LEPT|nr:hypothetical protein EHQ81_18090 [Leptospira selangorensis]TGM27263.1 hypothetical protein EHQ82_01810 [Leptospira selangorensis]
MGCSGSWNFWDDGNVDLSKATWLVAEKVPLIVDKGGTPGVTPTTPVNNLFTLPPGTKVKVSALGGVIDPTGTTIVNDFDGDGILNVNETTTNVWVADYPVIEAIIAPPVTMKIQILKNSQNTTDEITSDITSSDFESTKAQGSERIHQNEMNLRTVQFQDSFASSNELSNSNSQSTAYGTQSGIGPVQLGLNYSSSTSNSWEAKNSVSMTTTKWADKPFKNNIDTQANNLKSSSATSKAKKYRSEKTQKINETSQVDVNAGYVRAALYIKNTSVNMPVKLTNILCSLMFENGTGDLIPIQSFRLRNDDYSLFEVNVYGGSEFGPYVVQLPGLNTAEIENAMAAGYNPKIFIVDYEMSHVPDSNYKSSLLNFSGNNLKIIEENAKGRTGLIRIYGPNMRQMYRVAAFDTPDSSDPCVKTATTLSPGITLKKALERLQCNGLKIEFQDYIVDLSEVAPALGDFKLHLKGIKTLGPIPTNIPCDPQTRTGSDGVSRTACVQKPISTWSEEEKANAGVWAIYSNGKYYNLTEYFRDLDDSIRTFDPTNSQKVPMVKGVDSTIWAGDYYDIVYISFKDLLKKEAEKTFGTNPLETQREYKLNTSWDLNSFGKYPYDPEIKSLFLGKLGFGERFELNIKLDSNQYITPDFGLPINGGLFQYYSNFNYNITTDLKKLSINQVSDLEISLGFGGERSDWFNIGKDLDNSNAYKPKNCGRTLDYVNQTYTLCIELPTQHEYVDPDVSLINLYIRPSLNNAYRRTIWPLPYQDVRKMRGELGNSVEIGETIIKVSKSTGLAEVGENIYILGDPNPYSISSIGTVSSDGSYTVTVNPAIKKNGKKTTEVFVKGSLTSPDVRLTVENNFYTDWNTQVQALFQPTAWNVAQYIPFSLTSSIDCNTNQFHPANCLGVTPNLDAVNWMGAYNTGVAHWNSWADASRFSSFLSGGLFGLSTNSGKSYKLDASRPDLVLSDNIGTAQIYEPKVVVSGDTALMVYLSDQPGSPSAQVLKGKYFKVSTGETLSSEFTINVDPATTQIAKFSIDIKNSKAAVVWEESFCFEGNCSLAIYLKFFDLNSLATSATEKVVGAINNSYEIASTSVSIGDTKVIVSWNRFINNSTCEMQALTYNLDTETMSGSVIVVASVPISLSAQSSSFLVTKAIGDQAIVTGFFNSNSNTYNVYSSVVTLSTRAKTPYVSIPRPNSTGNISFNDVTLSIASGKALLSFKTPDNTLLGHILNIPNGTLQGSYINFDTGISKVKNNISGSIGLLSYSKGNRIYLRSLDLNSGLFRETSPFLVDSTASATSKKISATLVSGTNLISLWEHTEAGKSTIRGRSVSFSPSLAAKGPGDFFISTANQGNQTVPFMAGNTTNGFTAWVSQDTFQPKIRGTYFNLSNPGTLQYGMNNFFIAPMIERDFTIWTKVTQ